MTFQSLLPALRQWMPASLVLALCTAASGCTSVGLAVANLVVHGDAVASETYDAEHRLQLDVHRPAAPAAKAPVIVFFHGGSWRDGTRADYRFVGNSLAHAGWVVVVPDVRQAPAVVFPAFVEDAARAVAWTRAHASEFGGDPGRIVVMGHSSGAHLAALLGTDARYLRAVGLEPRDLSGVIGLSGPYDFLPIVDPRVREALGPESGWASTQPVNFVDGDEPRFLLLQGTSDTLVWPRNAPSLAARLRAQGEPVDLEMLDGVGHAGTLIGLLRDGSPVRRAVVGFAGAGRSGDAAPKLSVPAVAIPR